MSNLERNTYEGQKRFVIAHKLGHFFLHPKTRQVESVNQEQTTNWSDRHEIEEYEANIFAAKLLIPSAMFGQMIKGKTPSFELVDSLQKDFKTTLTATAVPMHVRMTVWRGWHQNFPTVCNAFTL